MIKLSAIFPSDFVLYTLIFQSAGNVLTGNKFKLKERVNLSQCWVADAETFLHKQVPEESKKLTVCYPVISWTF